MKSILAAAALLLIGWTPLPRTATAPTPLTLPQPLEGLGRFARVASDGRGFFAVSSAMSRGEYASFVYNGQYGIALDDRGDIAGAEVSHSGDGHGLAAVASSGASYLVVWHDKKDRHLYARRVSGEGRPIDTTPIVVCADEAVPDFSAAWDGSRYVVAYRKAGGLYDAQLVSETGELIGRPFGVAGSEVASNGRGTVLLATHQADDIDHERPLIVESFPLGPVEIGRGAQAVLSAGSGDELLVAYHFDSGVWARRLDRTARPIGPPIKLSSRSLDPSVTWAGDHWLVAFTAEGATPSVKAVRVGRESVIDTTPLLIAANASAPAVASNGTRVLITWRRESDGLRLKAMLDGSTLSNEGPLNRQLAAASVAGIAAMGETSVIAQTRNALFGEVDVWTVRDAAVRHLMTLPGPMAFEAVAAGGSHALLVTSTPTELRFHVIDGTGRIIGQSAIETRSDTITAHAHWIESRYVVIWSELTATLTENFMTTVDANGQASRRRVFAGAVTAAAHDRLLAVWSQIGYTYAAQIIGPGDAQLQIREEDETRNRYWGPVAAASDGSAFLVIFRDNDGSREMFLQRIAFDGTQTPARHVPTPPGTFPRMSLAWTGESYLLLAWDAGDPALYALRIEPSGFLIDRDFTPLATIPGLAWGNVPAVLVRGPREIEIVSAIPAEPFGSPGKTWVRLGGEPRRRAVR